MARRRSALRTAEHDTYLVNRTLGDLLAFQRGGILGLGKRIGRRKVRRATKGWL